MEHGILFKILQRKNKFRNPNHHIELPGNFIFTDAEYRQARSYIEMLRVKGIKYTYPGHEAYPKNFYRMKEPPLFIEYIGEEFWREHRLLAVVGSREIEESSRQWLQTELAEFLIACRERVGVVSGAARGVDQCAHAQTIRAGFPTVFVLPSGLLNVYPPDLSEKFPIGEGAQACFMSEFEFDQRPQKSHFYFRNRLIAALGEMTLVVQATLKSGSLLTVHHSLEFGKAVLTVPSHPLMRGFAGNLRLIKDGAFLVTDFRDLLEIWKAENWPN